jgi:predicted RNA-binding protein YlxR (DUF448 family)
MPGPEPVGYRECVAHPERTCIGCRTRAPVTELVRVVADPPGITIDDRRRLPGRGAWVHPLPACIEAATRRKAWARALKSPGISVDAAALNRSIGFRAGAVRP